MVVQEAVAHELQCNGGFSHTAVAQHYDLVDAEAARRARSLSCHSAACLRPRAAISATVAAFTPQPTPSPAPAHAAA